MNASTSSITETTSGVGGAAPDSVMVNFAEESPGMTSWNLRKKLSGLWGSSAATRGGPQVLVKVDAAIQMRKVQSVDIPDTDTTDFGGI